MGRPTCVFRASPASSKRFIPGIAMSDMRAAICGLPARISSARSTIGLQHVEAKFDQHFRGHAAHDLVLVTGRSDVGDETDQIELASEMCEEHLDLLAPSA